MSTQTPEIKRFFSPIVALIALAILAVGIVVSIACINGIMNGERASAKGCIFGVVLVAAGIAVFFGGAFKKGCTTCKKRFSLAYAEFVPSEYERVERVLNGNDSAALRALVHAEGTRAKHRACLEVGYCDKCRRVGQLRVIEMNHNGQYDAFKRGTKERPASPEMLEAALAVVGGREAPPQR